MTFDEIFTEEDNSFPISEPRKKNYVVICLDESGSMQTIKQQAIDFFNAQVTEARNASKDMDNRMCLITFNDKIKIVDWDVDANEVKLLDDESYIPADWTAMLDAVGKGISKLREQSDINDENVSVLFTVISDGMENASREYSFDAIRGLINEMVGTNRWTFTYLGSNQDLSKVKEMGISAGNIRAFDATPKGMNEASIGHVFCASNYYDNRTHGLTATSCFYGDAEVESSPGIGAAWGGKKEEKDKAKSVKKKSA